MTQPISNPRSDEIQVLRGIAILLVLIVHWSLGTQIFQWMGLINPGWIGVELFFVISGFVVIRSFERSDFDLGRFVAARTFRLYPALILLLVLSLVVNPVLPFITPPEGLGYFWVNEGTLLGQSVAVLLGMHPSATFGQSYTNGALWSLSKEFQFYAALACVVLVLKGIFRNKVVLRWCVFSVALGVYIGGLTFRGLLYFGETSWVGNILLAGKFELMALGVLAGMLPPALLESVASRARSMMPLLIGVPLIALMFSRDPHALTGAGDLLEGPLMVLIGWAFVILVIAASERRPARPSPGLARRMMLWLGDRSYTIFLLHFFTFLLAYYIAIYVYIPNLGQIWSWPVMQFVTSLLIMLPLVEVVYRHVELPMIEVGRDWLRNRRARMAPTIVVSPSLR